jgi:hypothetical protein
LKLKGGDGRRHRRRHRRLGGLSVLVLSVVQEDLQSDPAETNNQRDYQDVTKH